MVAGLLAVAGAACPVAGIALASQSSSQARAESQGIEKLDREFLTVIRFANLWEIPMGELAEERGSTQTVKDVGKVLAQDHTQLNTAVAQLAEQFDVKLPDQPTSSQKSWMADISSKEGVKFDQTFADRLRAAHGTVFGLIAEVRAGTRNATIRDFAQQANNIVMKHMTLLEGTGDVTADHGMFAEASARTTAYPENSLGSSDLLVGGIVVLVMIATTLVVVRTFSTRGSAE
ncbi:DUF4142 domain-containing protein [Actinophytocola sp.]|uniref:DUF4142 domain-containing protein n=1 Tax=Actinophytocola sp. TaxID=1872138 RepID=UPI0025C5293B|nr:DUF4142 domain-containing protein [Actinophytocola sp.]